MTATTAASPRAVIALPLYNGGEYFEPALRSLLGQTEERFVLLLVDDASTDSTPETAQRYAAADARLAYVRHECRIGMVANWRRCFELARERAPETPYFAWASDHDVWEPEWLERLLDELDAHPEAVLAYPLSLRMDAAGNVVREPWEFATVDIADLTARVRAAVDEMYAGSMIYGVFRADALERAGVFRRLLAPDRLLMIELSFQGSFRQVPDVLWHRRFVGLHSAARQRLALFGGRPPWHSYMPMSVAQTAALFWLYAVLGRGRPVVGRLLGLALAWEFCRTSTARYCRRTFRREQKRVKRRFRHIRHTLGKRRRRLVGQTRKRVRGVRRRTQVRRRLRVARRLAHHAREWMMACLAARRDRVLVRGERKAERLDGHGRRRDS